MQKVRAWYEHENIQVLQTLKFVTSISNPIFVLRRGDGCGPKWVIVGVKSQLSVASSKGCKSFTER